MARIRSVHPGFFTDEDLVGTSLPARLLFIGLGIEADDKGIFEWKPITIKMRIFPADNVDVEALLSELVGSNRSGSSMKTANHSAQSAISGNIKSRKHLMTFTQHRRKS